MTLTPEDKRELLKMVYSAQRGRAAVDSSRKARGLPPDNAARTAFLRELAAKLQPTKDKP